MHKLIYSLSVLVLLASCGQKENKEGEKSSEATTENGKPSKARLEELDKEFLTATELDEKKAKEFVGLCMEYADAFPDDKDTPKFLEKGALVAGALKKYRLKTDLLQFIIDKYDSYDNYLNVIYLQAIAWDTEMKDAASAKRFYLLVQQKSKDEGILESIEARLATIDSLSYDEHVNMVINNFKNQNAK